MGVGEQRQVEVPQSFPTFFTLYSSAFAWLLISLTIFQNTDRVGSDNFCLFFMLAGG